MTTLYINTNVSDTVAKISEFLDSIGFQFMVEVRQDAHVPCVKIDISKKLYKFQEWGCAPCEELVTLEKLKQRLSTQMRIIFVELLRGDTPEKVHDVMSGLGFSKDPMPGVLEFGEYIAVDTERKQFSYRMDGEHIPTNAVITTLDELLRRAIPKPIKPGPSYEWLEKQCASLKKQLLALGYEDRGGEMMAPPLGKPPEYILNDLSPEQAIQAFKDGKSVTVAGKPMTSGTTVEELLDSRLTLKHKRFGRIVLTDQVTGAPEVGTLVYRALTFSNKAALLTYSADMTTCLESGCLHYTEQGAIDHAEEMARLNRDGFVEMDVEALTRIKDSLKETLTPLTPEDPPKPFGWTSLRVKDAVEEIEGMLKEFY